MSQWTFGQSGRKVDAKQFLNNWKQLNEWVFRINDAYTKIDTSDGDVKSVWGKYKIELYKMEYKEEIDLEFGDYLVYENSKFFKVEKDFFEKFITVSGVGPKAAVRALNLPIPDIAQAIDAGDLSFLKSLPGIGEQRGKEIIAKLQGKMGKFGLMQSTGETHSKISPKKDVQEEAVEVLLQLQYKKDEARQMIQKAFQRKAGLASVEEILNEVYRQRKDK
jgi:hypothetical protein